MGPFLLGYIENCNSARSSQRRNRYALSGATLLSRIGELR